MDNNRQASAVLHCGKYVSISLGSFYGIHRGEQIKSYKCALFTITSFYKAMNPNLMMKFWQTFAEGFQTVLYTE